MNKKRGYTYYQNTELINFRSFVETLCIRLNFILMYEIIWERIILKINFRCVRRTMGDFPFTLGK